ncbi:MAG: hypothetical protein AAF514_10445, partial [Verrucomicrobiota bacterium]
MKSLLSHGFVSVLAFCAGVFIVGKKDPVEQSDPKWKKVVGSAPAILDRSEFPKGSSNDPPSSLLLNVDKEALRKLVPFKPHSNYFLMPFLEVFGLEEKREEVCEAILSTIDKLVEFEMANQSWEEDEAGLSWCKVPPMPPAESRELERNLKQSLESILGRELVNLYFDDIAKANVLTDFGRNPRRVCFFIDDVSSSHSSPSYFD